MKILYGVQATGNGHINRSREVVSALKQNGHDVFVILSGRDPQQLWDVEVFKPYTVYKGLTFGVSKGKVKYLKTIKGLNPFQFLRDIVRFDADGINLVVTDFEPLSAWIARLRNIPSIGLGRQYAFRYPIPLAKRDPVAQLVLRYFAPALYSIGLHYYHFNQPILPPIISNLTCNGVRNELNKIVVYLPFEELKDVKRLIQSFADIDFYIYTSVNKPSDDGNIHLRPFSRKAFIENLTNSNGVICNAGFTLTSEALHLGKKLLVKPLSGQLEQTSNALALKQLKLGMVMHALKEDVVGEWLKTPSPQPIRYPDVAREVADWIGKGKWNDSKELVNRVWSKVDTEVFESSL